MEDSMMSWITSEFESINFGDERINSRFYKIAEAFLEKPSAKITEITGSWAESKGAYRFFENYKVTKNKILSQHQAKTAERIKTYGKVVLAIQDTTYLDFTQLHKTQGLGPISCKHIHAKQKGIICHNTLAISPEGRVFGLIDQKVYRRNEETAIGRGSKGTKKRKLTPIQFKESYRWIETVKNVQSLVGSSKIVHVCDREGDIFELFHELLLTSQQFVIRAYGDRVVGDRYVGRPAITKKNTKLWAFMEARQPDGFMKVNVPKKDKQIKREAKCEIRYSQVCFTPPYYSPEAKTQVLLPITVFAIWVKEIDAPDGSESLEWMLITNIEIKSLEEAIEKINWYKKRWHIENYHKVLKSGCNIEKSKLNHADKLEKIITLMSIIATRIYELKLTGRSDPEMPCTEILNSEEWQILYCVTKKTSKLPAQPPSCKQAVLWIAKLGGFLGRKSDGEPGSIVVWRGWQKLTSIIENWKTFRIIERSG